MSRPGPSSTFPKNVRIRRRKDFRQLQRTGRKRATPHFLVVLGRWGEEARLGITVSRRVGNAVVRSRIKRLVREFFRRHRSRTPARDVLVVARPGARSVGYADVAEELGRAMGVGGRG